MDGTRPALCAQRALLRVGAGCGSLSYLEIVDAQIHGPEPVAPWEFGEESEVALSIELAREAIDCVGVDVALINAPDQYCLAAIGRYPDRFGGAGLIDYRRPDLEGHIAAYRSRPGMVAVRTAIRDWRDGRLLDDFRTGAMERLWALAERHGLPVFVSAQGQAAALAGVARKHPDLVLIVDHLGLPQQPMRVGPDPWAGLPDVIGLAAYPNVAVKFSGAITLSQAPYPYADIWPHLHRLVDAFSPQRLMWGSDYTRLRMPVGSLERAPRETWAGLYSDSVNFLRDTGELSPTDKEWMFAGTIRRLLRWPKAAW